MTNMRKRAREHNEIRCVICHVTKMVNTSAEREVFGLLDFAPGLRPAKILSFAVSPSLSSALNISVAAPKPLMSVKTAVKLCGS